MTPREHVHAALLLVVFQVCNAFLVNMIAIAQRFQSNKQKRAYLVVESEGNKRQRLIGAFERQTPAWAWFKINLQDVQFSRYCRLSVG